MFSKDSIKSTKPEAARRQERVSDWRSLGRSRNSTKERFSSKASRDRDPPLRLYCLWRRTTKTRTKSKNSKNIDKHFLLFSQRKNKKIRESRNRGKEKICSPPRKNIPLHADNRRRERNITLSSSYFFQL